MVNAGKGFERLVHAISQVSEPIASALNNLADRIEEVAGELRSERYRLDELHYLLRQLTERPQTRGEAGATELERLVGQLLRSSREHEEWLTNLSRQRTADRLTSGDYVVHQEISKRYQDLIGQQLLDVAAQAGDADRFAEARVRAGLARALFEPASVQHGLEHAFTELSKTVVTIPAQRFQSLWVTAAGIEHDAGTSGHQHSWVFDAEPGAALNPALQEPYEGCPADDPVLFVVAPAYVVDGKVYVRQLVFTGHAPSAGERSAAEPSVAEPSAAEPSVAEPSAAEPAPPGPAAAEPSAAEPTPAGPASAGPAAAGPAAAGPAAGGPARAEPADVTGDATGGPAG